MNTQTNLPVLRVAKELVLPDNEKWQFRFYIKSESSNRLYTIAQHKEKRYWGCSCPGWITNRNCKHLRAMGLPGHELPAERNIIPH